MKTVKHKVVGDLIGFRVYEKYYSTKEEALLNVRNQDQLKEEYVGEIEIDLYCGNCQRDLKPGDDYIKVSEHRRYCSSCYQEETFTSYLVDGEYVGDENDIEAYDEREKEI